MHKEFTDVQAGLQSHPDKRVSAASNYSFIKVGTVAVGALVAVNL